MTRYKRHAGDRVGPYVLGDPLGRGGNAEVWKADDGSGAFIALKVLDTRNALSERYQRFAREVAQMQVLTQEGFAGILPLVASRLPDKPTGRDPAWLAMPIATRIDLALGASPALGEVVRAVATVAHTLSRLAARSVFHRDVKPANLYEFNDSWVVGDFGLVSIPDAAPLTVGARSLGPRHFLAPEMIADPDSASGAPADVYSLAKTLWVLATGQNVPPPGEHRIDTSQFTISAYVHDPRAVFLDRLVERATLLLPSARPTITELAEELSAWLSDGIGNYLPMDESALGAEIMAALEPQRRAEAARVQRLLDAGAVLDSLGEAIAILAERIQAAGIPAIPVLGGEDGALNDRLTGDWVMRQEDFVGARYVKAGRLVTNESPYLDNSARSLYLWCAIGIRVDGTGLVGMAAAHLVGRDPRTSKCIWIEKTRGQLGSAQLETSVRSLRAQMIEKLPFALAQLRDSLLAGANRTRAMQTASSGDADALRITPHVLVEMVADATDVQRQVRLEPYLGRWMAPLSGSVENVSQHDSETITATFVDQFDPVIYLYFDLRWRNQLLALERGQIIRVSGRLQRVDTNTVHLGECRLV